MAKEKGWAGRLGLLLVLMFVVGLVGNGQVMAADTITPSEQIVSSETAALPTAPTVGQQVYGAALAGGGAGGYADSQLLPDQIILSWTADPQTTQTVAWRANSTITSGKVQYIKGDEESVDFSNAQEKEAVCSELYEGYHHFEVEIDNLEPDTTYIYRVGTDDCWSESGSFTTAALTDSFSFMYMGDVHIGYEGSSSVWGQLVAQSLTNYPELKFVLQGGDLIDVSENVSYWEELFNAAGGLFGHIPFMPTIGNHEFGDANSTYLKSFALPQNGPAGLKEHHYSFDYGNAHFVVLDSNLMGNQGPDYEAGIIWLENDLQSSCKDWKFAMFHHPPYGVTSYGEKEAKMIQETWVPVLERNGVDMVFVGHQHMYMRTYPIYENLVKEKPTEGITYVIGNASNKTYINPEEHDYIARVFEGSESTSYTIINIEGDLLTMTTRGINGNVIDEYRINKGSSDMDARVTVNSVKLLNSSYQEIVSVPAKGYCRLQAHLNNYTSKSQTATAVIQLRSGNDAAVDCGGESLGIVSLQSDVPVTGTDIYADFKIPEKVSAGSNVYVDVYVLDEADVPICEPYQQFSFQITP